jgi:succinate dehydrogenase / fumarate reductase cytochrome b subunit
MRPPINLLKIKFPFTALVSILHRVSGVLLFFALVSSPYLFILAKKNPLSFNQVIDFLNNKFIKFFLWGFLSLAIYHIGFGIRHIIMDMGYWQDMSKANISAYIFLTLVLFLSAFFAYRMFI